MRARPMTAEAAEGLAVEALGWIAGQEELLGAFLNASGGAPGDLRARVADPEFLGFVLDFLLADEPALIAFCENRGVAPDAPARARVLLPGGAQPFWT